MLLPPKRQCTLNFLKQILSKKKKYFVQSEVTHIKVPKCPELTVESVMEQVSKIPEIMAYLPDKESESSA